MKMRSLYALLSVGSLLFPLAGAVAQHSKDDHPFRRQLGKLRRRRQPFPQGRQQDPPRGWKGRWNRIGQGHGDEDESDPSETPASADENNDRGGDDRHWICNGTKEVDFVDLPRPTWPEWNGKSAKEAKAAIEMDCPNLHVIILDPCDSATSRDLRMDRVWIFSDDDVVCQVPMLG